MNLGHLDHVFITQIESGGVVMDPCVARQPVPVRVFALSPSPLPCAVLLLSLLLRSSVETSVPLET